MQTIPKLTCRFHNHNYRWVKKKTKALGKVSIGLVAGYLYLMTARSRRAGET